MSLPSTQSPSLPATSWVVAFLVFIACFWANPKRFEFREEKCLLFAHSLLGHLVSSACNGGLAAPWQCNVMSASSRAKQPDLSHNIPALPSTPSSFWERVKRNRRHSLFPAAHSATLCRLRRKAQPRPEVSTSSLETTQGWPGNTFTVTQGWPGSPWNIQDIGPALGTPAFLPSVRLRMWWVV